MAKTVALMTLYHPDNSVVKNVAAISEQVDRIFLCDNSTENNAKRFDFIRNVEYIFTGINLGISTAFNNVLKDETVDLKNDDFIIFFDQDSEIKSDHIEKLEKEFLSLQSQYFNIGCLGPAYFNRSNNSVEISNQKKRLNKHSYSVPSIITSSLLTTYGNLEKIGFFNDEIFLDFADWDLCWRFIYNNMRCCVTDGVMLNHAVGEGDKQVGILKVRSYPPQREYYQVRDSLYLMRKKYTPLKDKVRFAERISLEALFHCLALDKKKDRINYIIQGYKDFRHNITGELK